MTPLVMYVLAAKSGASPKEESDEYGSEYNVHAVPQDNEQILVAESICLLAM